MSNTESSPGARLPIEDRMQLIALQVLAEAGGPSGALSLVSAFRNAGIDIAEATAGRFLRQLDELGYTRSLGKRGRVLTDMGEGRLSQLQLNKSLAAHGARVTAAVGNNDIDQLIDLLHVRRAVEAEAAGLAAARATREEIDRIAHAATMHVHCVEDDNRVELSQNFDALVSTYSHNQMLGAMTATGVLEAGGIVYYSFLHSGLTPGLYFVQFQLEAPKEAISRVGKFEPDLLVVWSRAKYFEVLDPKVAAAMKAAAASARN
jgi:hypothetical protein